MKEFYLSGCTQQSLPVPNVSTWCHFLKTLANVANVRSELSKRTTEPFGIGRKCRHRKTLVLSMRQRVDLLVLSAGFARLLGYQGSGVSRPCGFRPKSYPCTKWVRGEASAVSAFPCAQRTTVIWCDRTSVTPDSQKLHVIRDRRIIFHSVCLCGIQTGWGNNKYLFHTAQTCLMQNDLSL